jgi:putative proteasome-type protease
LDGRFFVLLSAGNLATTQAVVARLQRDLREHAPRNLATCERIRDVADYVGETSVAIQDRYRDDDRDAPFNSEANFILGGQIGEQPAGLFHIYPQGNFVSPTRLSPFLQIGEQKYGKPILDRIVRHDTPLETVMQCGLVSMDSTMRSNAGVGPPIEMIVYRTDGSGSTRRYLFEEGDPYLQKIREAWEASLLTAVTSLPELPESVESARLRVVDRA